MGVAVVTDLPQPSLTDPDASPKVVSIARHPDFVPIATPKDEPPVLRGYFDGERCFHKTFVVDHFARKVRCSHCKVDIDPIDALHQLTTYVGCCHRPESV